jgi:hypothetical protein
MFKIGDTVLIEDSAKDDCCEAAWPFIEGRRKAVVKDVRARDTVQPAPSDVELALEFETPFAGGHDCKGACAPRQGQYTMANNVSLCSGVSLTIPLLTGPEFPAVDNERLAKVL